MVVVNDPKGPNGSDIHSKTSSSSESVKSNIDEIVDNIINCTLKKCIASSPLSKNK